MQFKHKSLLTATAIAAMAFIGSYANAQSGSRSIPAARSAVQSFAPSVGSATRSFAPSAGSATRTFQSAPVQQFSTPVQQFSYAPVQQFSSAPIQQFSSAPVQSLPAGIQLAPGETLVSGSFSPMQTCAPVQYAPVQYAPVQSYGGCGQ